MTIHDEVPETGALRVRGGVVRGHPVWFPRAFLFFAGLSMLVEPGHAAFATDMESVTRAAVQPGTVGDSHGGLLPVRTGKHVESDDGGIARPGDGSAEMGRDQEVRGGWPTGPDRKKVAVSQPFLSVVAGKDDAPMVRVPAGPFTMGSPEGTTHARPDEFPEHEVYMKDFYIDQYEVTVEHYRRFVYDENRAAPGPWGFIDQKRDAKKPVVSITWQEASEYCRWVGKRLPTEAEWEKAARGPEKRTYPWGESAPDSQTANFGRIWEPEKIYSEKLTDVGTYERGKSPYGVYDMAGNVWEWVQDWYGATYYHTSPRENPPGPSSGEFKVLRGGSWNDDPMAMRSAVRNWDHPSEGEVDIGFRCVRDAPDAP